ncbi:MAG: pyruvate dehydrogenase (acetyl-transferring), homodimeric type [Myxococcales bacterium]|nr:pyruvate dehydrogenase (acetyl-transferring), homodimeric type [Myxococcales bacterium]MCB9577098.1 pyruvate dehydrogenase (acetyl-transferring), homodimeric type [Polyangiaceae bacterium]
MTLSHDVKAPLSSAGVKAAPADSDPLETREWIESVDAVIDRSGTDRARYLLSRVLDTAQRYGVAPCGPLTTDYINTIPAEQEATFPGDEWMEKRIRRIIRWNAVAMVHRANVMFPGIGGHLSTYASSASLYEVGFNHFFRGKDRDGTSGDHIYFQGHAAPGIYSRAFLEGRLSIEAMERFRREAELGRGLSSYPHPRLMPNFWEFPTVSMGLGPINAIYHARFNRYLHSRGICDTSASRVWAFLGDGETDEPEALGSLSIAAREGLDNLTFVINCNLQRLDGPVRGNGKIIQELEAVFRGAGWNVIKVIWGPEWDELLANDREGVLRRRMNEVVDGQWQKYTTATGEYTRKDFFGVDPRLLAMVEHLTDDQIRKLRRGGHSYRKVYSALKAATEHNGRPTVVLAHTVKGWTLGEAFEGSNVTHQKKKLEDAELKAFRDVLHLPVPDDKLHEAPFYHPGMNSPEVEYVLERRHALGGVVPKRRDHAPVKIELPRSEVFSEFLEGTGKGEASTTMAFARMLSKLLRDKKIGRRIVPIIPDEARTFGMDALFSQVGIYSSKGQLYEPVDKGKLLYYRESKDGQVLEEGITEAGSMASFVAAGTAYATQGQPMIPFYIFYSMFGFQRTGDLAWAAGDAMARGFMLGATAGRTTLNGEGLQHEDGHSHLLASTVPSIVAYDVAYAYELAVIIEDGLRRMFGEEEHVFYYITLQNENYAMPAMPEGVREGILRGIYRVAPAPQKKSRTVQLFGSGSILREVLRAQEILADRFDVAADVWSVTSYNELRRNALAAERHNRLHPEDEQRVPHVQTALDGVKGPFVAATDYMKMVSDQIARWVPGRYVTLGTDGFGMSDTREALRRHFEVDAESIVVAALDALRQEGQVDAKTVARAIDELGIDPNKADAASI